MNDVSSQISTSLICFVLHSLRKKQFVSSWSLSSLRRHFYFSASLSNTVIEKSFFQNIRHHSSWVPALPLYYDTSFLQSIQSRCFQIFSVASRPAKLLFLFHFCRSMCSSLWESHGWTPAKLPNKFFRILWHSVITG